MPAATSAPKATSRITSVIGSDVRSAFWKSLSKTLDSSLFALAAPNCSILMLGRARWAAAVAAIEAPTRSLAASSPPGTTNFTSAERPSKESWLKLASISGERTSRTDGSARRRRTTSRIAASNTGWPMPTPVRRPCTSTISSACLGK
jgi:hypothetical protein